MAKLADHVTRAKASPVSTYLFHLYHQQELLSAAEIIQYDTGKTLLSYGLSGEEAEDPVESEPEELPEERLTDPRTKKRKSTDPGSRIKPPDNGEGGVQQGT